MNIFTSTTTDQAKKDVFALPLTYLPSDGLHKLPSHLCEEFELVQLIKPHNENESSTKPIYEYLFQPSHTFGKNGISLWKHHYTSNIEYLQNQQHILSNMDSYCKHMDSYQTQQKYRITDKECETMTTLWDSTQNDPHFLENYGFMEINMLKFLNKSPLFLQTTSILNMTSPFLSFLIPIMMLLFPFILLNIQGIPVNFEEYMKILGQIAKRHFIGMAINVTREFNMTNSVYFVGMLVLYIYQMYSNYNCCVKFYSKMRELNNELLELKKYVNYSLESIQQFLSISETCGKYDEFNKVVNLHNQHLKNIRDVLISIYEFQPSLSKITQIGYMQQCLYEIHSNIKYAEALSWSFGFEGYMDNLRGVYENLKNKKLNYTKYNSSRKLYIENQKYVPIEYQTSVHEKGAIGNNCDLEKNILISGPNASGKTTYLKTTLLNVLFSQQIGCGYFKYCRMNPYVYIHSYLNIPDTSERDSLFQAESRRCKEILDCLSNNDQKRHLCVFDELYSGTNPEEATKSSYAFLKYLTRYNNLDFILTTHYLKVCKKLKKNASIQCCQMDAIVHPNQEIEYTYKMKKGISKIQGAYCVLKNMDYPTEILNYYHEICCKKRE